MGGNSNIFVISLQKFRFRYLYKKLTSSSKQHLASKNYHPHLQSENAEKIKLLNFEYMYLYVK